MGFQSRINKADDYDLYTRTLAIYLEVTIMDERFVGSPCSFMAAGAHCLSRFFPKKGDEVIFHFFLQVRAPPSRYLRLGLGFTDSPQEIVNRPRQVKRIKT